MNRIFILALLLSAPLLRAQDTVEFLEERLVDFKPSPPAISWLKWEAATGDWFGARSLLQERGVEFFGGYGETNARSGFDTHWDGSISQ